MEATIKKWGRTPAIRIPVSLMESAGLTVDNIVNIREENKRIVIEPLGMTMAESSSEIHLAELANVITETNRHEAIEFGPAAAREIW